MAQAPLAESIVAAIQHFDNPDPLTVKNALENAVASIRDNDLPTAKPNPRGRGRPPRRAKRTKVVQDVSTAEQRLWPAALFLGIHRHYQLDPAAFIERFNIPAGEVGSSYDRKLRHVKRVLEVWGNDFWFVIRNAGVLLPQDPSRNLVDQLAKLTNLFDQAADFAVQFKRDLPFFLPSIRYAEQNRTAFANGTRELTDKLISAYINWREEKDRLGSHDSEPESDIPHKRRRTASVSGQSDISIELPRRASSASPLFISSSLSTPSPSSTHCPPSGISRASTRRLSSVASRSPLFAGPVEAQSGPIIESDQDFLPLDIPGSPNFSLEDVSNAPMAHTSCTFGDLLKQLSVLQQDVLAKERIATQKKLEKDKAEESCALLQVAIKQRRSLDSLATCPLLEEEVQSLERQIARTKSYAESMREHLAKLQNEYKDQPALLNLSNFDEQGFTTMLESLQDRKAELEEDLEELTNALKELDDKERQAAAAKEAADRFMQEREKFDREWETLKTK